MLLDAVNRPSARSSSGTAVGVHVVVLDRRPPRRAAAAGRRARSPGGSRPGRRRRRRPPPPGRGRPPPAARRCRPARTADCTAPRPPRPSSPASRSGIGDVARHHLDRPCRRRCGAGSRSAAGDRSTAITRPGRASSATDRAIAPGAAAQIHHRRAGPRCARSPSRPAARSPAAARTPRRRPPARGAGRRPYRAGAATGSAAPAARPARSNRPGLGRRRIVVDQHQPPAADPEHVRGEQLGIDARRRHPRRGQVRSGLGQHRSQRRPFGPSRGVFVRGCHGIIMKRRV